MNKVIPTLDGKVNTFAKKHIKKYLLYFQQLKQIVHIFFALLTKTRTQTTLKI